MTIRSNFGKRSLGLSIERGLLTGGINAFCGIMNLNLNDSCGLQTEWLVYGTAGSELCNRLEG